MVGDAVVTGTDSAGLYLDIPITLFNPSNIIASVGTIYFQVSHQQVTLGVARLDNFIASQGDDNDTAHAYITFSPDDAGAAAAGRDLLSNFAMGNAVQTSFAGTMGNSTDIPVLKSGLAGITLSANTPGLTTKLITSGKLNLGLLSLLESGISADVTVDNRMVLMGY
jgi:hypothetical protein